MSNIDDIADRRTDTTSISEKIQSQYLENRSSEEQVEYLNDMIVNIINEKMTIQDKEENAAMGILENDVDEQIGPLYQSGISDYVGENSAKNVDEEDIGKLALELNRIRKRKQDEDELENIQITELLTSATRKATTEEVRVSDRNYTSVTEVMLEILSSRDSEGAVSKLVEKLQDENKSIIEYVDEPQMVTELWNHQREALEEWIRNDMSGYVEMATATGKTVLGISAIAAKYGGLSPEDEIKMDIDMPKSNSGKSEVLVVTDRKILINQWKDEINDHLAIPESRVSSDDNVIDLSWGEIHLKNPGSIEDASKFDLVIVDEMHHYLRNRKDGWKNILKSARETDLIAMTGTLDAQERRTADGISERLYSYDEEDARNDNVISDFEFNIAICPIDQESKDSLSEASKFVSENHYRHESTLSDEFSYDYNFSVLKDIINFASTTEGKEFVEENEDFAMFSRKAKSRRANMMNATPDSDFIAEMSEMISGKKVVVTLRSHSQVQEVSKYLQESERNVYTLEKGEQDMYRTVENFNEDDSDAIIVGVGKTLGEGVDMQDAEVCINSSKGRVGPKLIQRIGRILRTSEDKGECRFYNIVQYPWGDSLIKDQDGIRLAERFVDYKNIKQKYNLVENPSVKISKNIKNEVSESKEKARDIVERNSFSEELIDCLDTSSFEDYLRNETDENHTSKTDMDDSSIEAKVSFSESLDEYIEQIIEEKIQDVSQKNDNQIEEDEIEMMIDRKVERKVQNKIEEMRAEIVSSMLEEVDEMVEDSLEENFGVSKDEDVLTESERSNFMTKDEFVEKLTDL